jgi:hypothetical protein
MERRPAPLAYANADDPWACPYHTNMGGGGEKRQVFMCEDTGRQRASKRGTTNSSPTTNNGDTHVGLIRADAMSKQGLYHRLMSLLNCAKHGGEPISLAWTTGKAQQ